MPASAVRARRTKAPALRNPATQRALRIVLRGVSQENGDVVRVRPDPKSPVTEIVRPRIDVDIRASGARREWTVR
ncbi:hypothetical protein MMC25_000528 [Agyrium rufum]|nr:hypothetical protein [Agyrium rufum]